MTFYQAMQLGAVNLKPLIKDCEDKNLKMKYTIAFILKNILCLLFCMAVVMCFSALFGEENSIVGVITIVALLTFRFSNLNFDVKQSAITMIGIFGILIVGPHFAAVSNPILGFIINFICILTIVILACHNVNLSNQSIFILSYLLLYGNEVSSNVLINRAFGLILGAIIVAGIFYYKQKHVKFENTISTIIKDVDFKNERTKWQVKFTFGVCLSLLIGELFNLPRAVWIAFACVSVLQPNQEKIDTRYKIRPIYTIVGCIAFTIIYLILPNSIKSNIGLIGGLMVGFSATYHWQTVFNCFGALASVIPILGLEGAIVLRVAYNILGSLYAKCFNKIFDKVADKIEIEGIIDEMA